MILAALATIPGREATLAQCLASLRPQVDVLRVICHDVQAPPAAAALADEVVCIPDTAGSAAKLRWARAWKGTYLACDDDFLYPPDYVATMTDVLARYGGQALVTCHGRILTPHTKGFLDCTKKWPPQEETVAAWINYPGACALAFDTKLRVPSTVPGKNLEEVHLAVWAQQNRVPIALVPHAKGWLKYLLAEKEGPTIWQAEKSVGFKNRNAVLREHSRHSRWRVYECK